MCCWLRRRHRVFAKPGAALRTPLNEVLNKMYSIQMFTQTQRSANSFTHSQWTEACAACLCVQFWGICDLWTLLTLAFDCVFYFLQCLHLFCTQCIVWMTQISCMQTNGQQHCLSSKDSISFKLIDTDYFLVFNIRAKNVKKDTCKIKCLFYSKIATSPDLHQRNL